jgi:hypothetical protein
MPRVAEDFTGSVFTIEVSREYAESIATLVPSPWTHVLEKLKADSHIPCRSHAMPFH